MIKSNNILLSVVIVLTAIELSRAQLQQNLDSVSRKMGILEVTVREQSVEINQLKARIQKQEMQLSMANVQIETLLQAQHRDAYHNSKNSFNNVLATIQEMDTRIKHLESKLAGNSRLDSAVGTGQGESNSLESGSSESECDGERLKLNADSKGVNSAQRLPYIQHVPGTKVAAEGSNQDLPASTKQSALQTICFQPETNQNSTDLMSRFQALTANPVFFFYSNCSTSNKSLLLLCDENSTSDSVCQCPTAQIKTGTSRLLCTNYSRNNLQVTIRFSIDQRKLDDSWTPLLILCRFYLNDNLIDLVHRLIDQNSTVVKEKTSYRSNALMALCQYSDNSKIVDIAQLLVDKGLPINQTNVFESNALMDLCRFSQSDRIVEMAQFLINKGIHLNHTNYFNCNALMALSRYSQNKKIVSVAKLLITAGIEINQETQQGDNALLWLIRYSQSDQTVPMTQLLLENNVNIHHKDKEGYNALMTLVRYFNNSNDEKIVEIAELLISKNISVNHTDAEYEENALTLLCRYSTSEKMIQLAELLIEKGSIDLNHTNYLEYNALMVLCRYSNSEKIVDMAQFLIAKGVNVSHKTQYGDNALSLLCEFSKSDKILQVAELLIAKGVGVVEDAADYLSKRSIEEVPNKAKIVQLIRKAYNNTKKIKSIVVKW